MKPFVLSIHNFLRKKIVYPSKTGIKLIISLVSFGLVFSFLIVYTPFRIYEIGEDKYLLALIVSCFTASTILFVFIISPFIFPVIRKPEGYTNLKMIIQFLFILLIALLLNYLYLSNSKYSQQIKIDAGYIFLMMDIIFFPGILLANLVNWKRKELIIIDIPLADKHIAINELNNLHSEVAIYTAEHDVAFKFQIDDFIYACSSENYSEIYIIKEGIVTRNLIRITFINLFDILHVHPQIIRCHRTRIVNLTHVIGLVKDGKSTFVRLAKINKAIPVSRNYPVEKHFASLNQ